MRVLVAVDGSPASEVARGLVASLPWSSEDTLRFVTVLSDSMTVYGAQWAALAVNDPDELDLRLHAASRAVVDGAVAATHTSVACTVEAAVLRGRPPSAIIEEAAAFGADLVVMGTRGHGPFQTAILGSVSAEVVDHAPCPVLIARGRSIERILLAEDGSDAAAIARHVIAGRPFAGYPVRIVSVAVVPPPWQAAVSPLATEMALDAFDESVRIHREEHQASAEAAARDLAGAGIAAEVEVRLGDAAGEIVSAATDWDAGLIAMGTHGRTGVARLLIGSVARNVLHHAPCSVLVARVAAPAAGEG